jgi:S-adenosylmethionine:tRNA ribosyltransferase-isomerase
LSALAVAEPLDLGTLPDDLVAAAPPEAQGLARDDVRLMIASGDDLVHARFRDLTRVLGAGTLLVVNTSATIAAAADGTRAAGRAVVVHFATPLDDGSYVVELREPDGSGPQVDGRRGERVRLSGNAHLHLIGPESARGGDVRLWRAIPHVGARVESWLELHGRPITYGKRTRRWPLSMYQTVFAREPGSAEMPSAARPFTPELVTGLVSAGVTVAPIVLHAGVSSLEGGEPPQPERYRVPAETARLVNHTRRSGGRVLAVGTTVARALETVARPDGSVMPGAGWTELVLSAARPARTVDALLTGWHEPGSSHLQLLEAVAGRSAVRRAYDAALTHGYLWHEFGDSCLFLGDGAIALTAVASA